MGRADCSACAAAARAPSNPCPQHTPDAFRIAYDRAKAEMATAHEAFERAREAFGWAAEHYRRLSDLVWRKLDGEFE